ncbi:MAG: glycosyltransferase, partial [Gaiellales bacterium]
MEVGLALATLGGLAVVGWLGLLLSPATGWRLRPQAEDDEPPPGPEPWPAVSVLIPARNESRMLRCALPSILDQDYPGPWRIVLVDDRSSDGTTPSAAKLAQDHPAGGRLKVVAGDPLPDGWVGKVWALEQGARALADEPPAYVLLTDADIAHAPWSLRTLVSQSEHQGLALNSRMARLHCRSRPERLLIPAFVYFFNLLYPMRRVNRPASSIAAAAGGCMLVRWDALAETGGFEGIRSEIIDDVNLARQLKSPARPIR